MRKNILLAGAIFYLSLLCSCKKENTQEPRPALTIATSYDSSGYAANVSVEAGVRKQLADLVNEIKKGRTVTNTVSEATLKSLYEAGNPSLKSLTTPYYQSIVEAQFKKVQDASGNVYMPAATLSGKGGVYDNSSSSKYLYDETGLEMEQIIEKGLFSAMMYNHALSIVNSGLTERNVDRILCIWGASPLFPNTNTASKTPYPDAFSAVYAARRDKNDGQGLYTKTKEAFLKLKSAVKAGDRYKQEQDEALGEIKLNWEKALFATVINYCFSAKSRISATSPTAADYASALHALGEAAGFAHGWKTISDKKITDAQIDQILSDLGAPTGASGSSTYYKYVTDSFNSVPKLDKVINNVKSIYGFTDAEVEDFKENWINKQSR